eukprot:1328485-Amphidinium_carterae.1
MALATTQARTQGEVEMSFLDDMIPVPEHHVTQALILAQKSAAGKSKGSNMKSPSRNEAMLLHPLQETHQQ